MNIKLIGAAVLAGAMIAGCNEGNKGGAAAPSAAPAAKAEKKANVAAVTVNGEKLMTATIDADVERLIKAQGEKIPADQLEYAKQMFRNQLAQGFLIEKVLVGKAKKDGFTVTDADRKARETEFLEAAKKMPNAPKSLAEYFKKFPLGEERAKKEFENGILIDKMIKAAQAKAPAKDFKAEAKKRVAEAVAANAKAKAGDAEAEKKIKALKAQLDKVAAKDLPAKFAELAKANSACPSSAKGGDLGEFTHGQMVKEFDEVAFKLPVNKVSDPVKTQFGYHLIMTTKKIPAVEAKGDKPASPEKVQASHILIKAGEVQRVPTEEEVIKFMQKNEERQFVQGFVLGLLRAAKIEAIDEFKGILPPPEEKPAAAPAAAVKEAVKDAKAVAKDAKAAAKDAKAAATAVVSKPVEVPVKPAKPVSAKPVEKSAKK